MTSYPIMLIAAWVLSIASFVMAGWLFLAWIVRTWRDVLRDRTPVVKGEDGVWRAARRRS